MTRAEFEMSVRRLVGLAPRGVRYFEIDYSAFGANGDSHSSDRGDSGPAWSVDPRFDSLDFGLQLLTATGDTVDISWGNEFYPYGVSLNVPLTAGDTIRVWDVSETSRWSSLLGRRIQEARVFWSWVEGRDIGRVHYPQDVKLTFDGGREVYISALEIRLDGSFMGMMDHITVFFEESVARQFAVGVETPE
jgi:hypothetical protein